MASVTRKAKPERRQRRAEVRSRLLTATETLLERGRAFTDITVEELIIEAAVARSTFYAHFEDKGALLLELTDHVTRELEVAAARWYRLPRDATRGDLRDALAELMASYRNHRLSLAAVVEAAAYDPRVRVEYENVMQSRIAEMERSYHAQRLQGGVRSDIDIAQVSVWIGWMTERGLFQLFRGDADDAEPGAGSATLDASLEGMTTIIWRAFYEGAR